MENDLTFEPIAVPEEDLELMRFRRSQMEAMCWLSIPAAPIQEVEDVT